MRASTDLAVGERVFAIGNPRGYEQTLTEGLISGLRKEGDVSLVQTSAAISPGSSGGGLFDSKGRLIGITTKSRMDSQNLNFAHPTEWVSQLMKNERSLDGGTLAPPRYTVSERPSVAICEMTQLARWGMFSEGLELLESGPTKGSILVSQLDTTQPMVDTFGIYVLADLSRKSQVALFQAGGLKPALLVSFEESGDVKATLAEVEDERGTPRLLTRSGACQVGSVEELGTRRKAPTSSQSADPCESSAASCYASAKGTAGGERFVLLKKACRLGHVTACDEAIALAEGVNDTANAQQLRSWRGNIKRVVPEEESKQSPTPPAPTQPPGARKPLLAK